MGDGRASATGTARMLGGMAAGMSGGRMGRRVGRDRRVRQAHRPRPVGDAGPRRLALLVRPLLADLVQLRHLMPDLLALGLAHPHHPQVPPGDRVGRQPVQRHAPSSDGRPP